MKVKSFKMPFQNNAFNKNQRVWVVFSVGWPRLYCVGKWRGKGNYVHYWVNYDTVPTPYIQEFEISDNFAKRLGI